MDAEELTEEINDHVENDPEGTGCSRGERKVCLVQIIIRSMKSASVDAYGQHQQVCFGQVACEV
jgi:hypothetical protein